MDKGLDSDYITPEDMSREGAWSFIEMAREIACNNTEGLADRLQWFHAT